MGNSRFNLETGEFEIVKPLEVFSADEGRLDCYKINGVPVSEDIRPGDRFPIEKRDLHRDFHRRNQLKKLNDDQLKGLVNNPEALANVVYGKQAETTIVPETKPETKSIFP